MEKVLSFSIKYYNPNHSNIGQLTALLCLAKKSNVKIKNNEKIKEHIEILSLQNEIEKENMYNKRFMKEIYESLKE